MLPLIRTGDRIDVRFDPVDVVRPGDLVLLERSGRLILHRVLRRVVREGSVIFWEKGDHQLTAAPMPAAAALGRVIRVRRGERVYDLESLRGRWVGRGLLWGARLEAALPALRRAVVGPRPTRAGGWWRRLHRGVRAAWIRVGAGGRSSE